MEFKEEDFKIKNEQQSINGILLVSYVLRRSNKRSW